MALLGKLKDGRPPSLALDLTNPHDVKQAGNALIALGPVGKDAVMPYLSHEDRRVRQEAARVLGTYGVKDNLKLAQALGDLRSQDGRLRSDAARALAVMPVEEGRRVEVAEALQASLENAGDRGAQEQAARALATWGREGQRAGPVASDGRRRHRGPRPARGDGDAGQTQGQRPQAGRQPPAQGAGPGRGQQSPPGDGAGIGPADRAAGRDRAEQRGQGDPHQVLPHPEGGGESGQRPAPDEAGGGSLQGKPMHKDVAEAAQLAIASINDRGK